MLASLPELSYFDAPGRANLTRLAFKASGTSFVDTRVSFEEWPKIKADPSSVPSQLFGTMPTIKHGDVLIGTSAATCVYAAELGNLVGSTAQDRAVCQMLVNTNEELRVLMLNCLSGSEESKATNLAALGDSVVKFLTAIERVLERKTSNGPFFLDTLSLADLAVFDNVNSPYPGLRALGVDLTAYPKIVACADAVAAASPAVAAFVAAGWK